MKKTSLYILLLTVLPCFAFAQAKLTSLSRNKFYTQSDNVPIVLTVYGENLWPDYMDHSAAMARVKVFFRKGDKIQEVRRVSSNKELITVDFFSDEWLTNTTPVQVYVETDGVRSNSLALLVVETPKIPPVINSISPGKFATGQATDKYVFRIYGINLGEIRTTWVKINGIQANESFYNHLGGVLDVWIPKALINSPGSYPVQVCTKYGISNIVSLVIEKPLLTIAPVGVSGTKVYKSEAMTAIQRPVNTVQIKPSASSFTLLNGVKIKMQGDVYYAEDKSIIENYARGLDEVYMIDNQINVSKGSSQVSISITARGVEKITLEHVKLSLEKKLSAMGINKTVTIE